MVMYTPARTPSVSTPESIASLTPGRWRGAKCIVRPSLPLDWFASWAMHPFETHVLRSSRPESLQASRLYSCPVCAGLRGLAPAPCTSSVGDESGLSRRTQKLCLSPPRRASSQPHIALQEYASRPVVGRTRRALGPLHLLLITDCDATTEVSVLVTKSWRERLLGAVQIHGSLLVLDGLLRFPFPPVCYRDACRSSRHSAHCSVDASRRRARKGQPGPLPGRPRGARVR